MLGRGSRFTSAKIQRHRKQPVTITREIPNFTGLPLNRARGAPSRQFSCCAAIPKLARGFGHGY